MTAAFVREGYASSVLLVVVTSQWLTSYSLYWNFDLFEAARKNLTCRFGLVTFSRSSNSYAVPILLHSWEGHSVGKKYECFFLSRKLGQHPRLIFASLCIWMKVCMRHAYYSNRTDWSAVTTTAFKKFSCCILLRNRLSLAVRHFRTFVDLR